MPGVSREPKKIFTKLFITADTVSHSLVQTYISMTYIYMGSSLLLGIMTLFPSMVVCKHRHTDIYVYMMYIYVTGRLNQYLKLDYQLPKKLVLFASMKVFYK